MNPLGFKKQDFVHLHLHSDYSLLQSAIQLKPLAKRLSELEMKACAVTDYGNMFGAVSFHKTLRSEGVRPIIGYEAYLSSGSRFDRDSIVRSGGRATYNLVLLAENLDGYHNLVQLASRAFTDGLLNGKPRIDLELLTEFSDGIIALSGGYDGEIGYHLRNNDEVRAADAAGRFLSIFGDQRFFLEIQDHGQAHDRDQIQKTAKLAEQLGLQLVATNDVHYLSEDDARAHEVMLCIGAGRTLGDSSTYTLPTPTYYLRSADEMWKLFGKDYPDALLNSVKIAEMCDVNPEGDKDKLILPMYPIPPDSSCTTLGEFFEEKIFEGFEERKSSILSPMQIAGTLRYDFEAYENRLKREIEVIEKMGYEGYFLIVWDFIKYAIQQNIPVGPGRGSAAGSLVAYCLGITGIDPLQYDLLFERFLNPERISMPDIDIDFCIRGRGDVINHVTDLYGRDSVCQIITFGTMASKAAIKDVGRALNMPYADVEKIAKLVPPPIRGRNVSISQALETVPELKDLFAKDRQVKDLIDLALRLEGCARHSSVHAAGVVISPRPLHEIVPVAISSKNELTSQYSMTDLESVGMLKMDFLALTTLTVVNDCLSTIRDKEGIEIDWSSVSLSDEKTMELFGEGRTDAVFQFESSGMQEICRRLKPKELEDLSALNALYRPGPLDGGMIEDFIQRHKGAKKVRYLVKEMEDILSNTYGVLVYQEQIMQIAQKLAGYSLGEADMMRRAMGKKKREAMAKEGQKFVQGAVANGINLQKAEEIFDLMSQFADYGFNRSHSIAYAYLAFQTGYLKAHYPAHFFAAVLSHESDDSAKVYKYSTELKQFGLKLLPPDINESGFGFTPAGDSVRFGLGAIKGIGSATINAITEARKSGAFTSLFDLTSRLEQGAIGKRGLESLIMAGALDSFATHESSVAHLRPSLMAAVDDAIAYGQKIWSDKLSGQNDLFGILDGTVAESNFALPDTNAWNATELSRNEKAALGFYLSSHPLDEHIDALLQLQIKSIADYELEVGAEVEIAGIVSGAQIRYSKKGNRFCLFQLEDRSTGLKCALWGQAFSEFSSLVQNDELLVVTGRLKADDGREITLVVNEIRPLHEAQPSRATSVAITLPMEKELSEDYFFGLLAMLNDRPGLCSVSIEMPVEGLAVKFDAPSVRVKGSMSLERDLMNLGCSVTWVI